MLPKPGTRGSCATCAVGGGRVRRGSRQPASVYPRRKSSRIHINILQQLPRPSDQRLSLFSLFNHALRKQAMLECVSVLFRRARTRRAANKVVSKPHGHHMNRGCLRCQHALEVVPRLDIFHDGKHEIQIGLVGWLPLRTGSASCVRIACMKSRSPVPSAAITSSSPMITLGWSIVTLLFLIFTNKEVRRKVGTILFEAE